MTVSVHPQVCEKMPRQEWGCNCKTKSTLLRRIEEHFRLCKIHGIQVRVVKAIWAINPARFTSKGISETGHADLPIVLLSQPEVRGSQQMRKHIEGEWLRTMHRERA